MYYVSRYIIPYDFRWQIDIWDIKEKVVPDILYVSEQGRIRYGECILKYNLFKTENRDEAIGYMALEEL